MCMLEEKGNLEGHHIVLAETRTELLILYLLWDTKKRKNKNCEVMSFLRSLKVLKECVTRKEGRRGQSKDYCLLSPNLECGLLKKFTLF